MTNKQGIDKSFGLKNNFQRCFNVVFILILSQMKLNQAIFLRIGIMHNHEGAWHCRKPLGRRKGFNIFITLGLTKIKAFLYNSC